MKRNYLLVYKNKFSGEILYRYFETTIDMKDFIRVNLSQKRYFEVLHKYKIEEITESEEK